MLGFEKALKDTKKVETCVWVSTFYFD